MDQLYREKRLVEVYDALNPSRNDFDFYRAHLPTPPARVLDIGCGTGSFAIELAAAGYAITAIDPAPDMIAVATSTPDAHKVQWLTGFVADLEVDTAFDAVVMTGHAFQCLLSDDEVLDLFRDVSRHLSDGASFWFETRNPAAKAWKKWTPVHARPPVPLDGGGTVQVTHEVEAVEGEIVTFSEIYAFSNDDKRMRSRSRLRFMPLASIDRLAATAGLRVAAVAGNWDASAFDERSPEIILQLKPAR